MELAPDAVRAMVDLAFTRMLDGGRTLGERVSEQPDLPGANSVFAIVTHCVGVTDYWLDHTILGAPSDRDRDAELVAAGTVDELEAQVHDLLARLPAMLAAVARADAAAVPRPERADPVWPWTPPGITLHVLEELFQHAGHVDLTVDLLLNG